MAGTNTRLTPPLQLPQGGVGSSAMRQLVAATDSGSIPNFQSFGDRKFCAGAWPSDGFMSPSCLTSERESPIINAIPVLLVFVRVCCATCFFNFAKIKTKLVECRPYLRRSTPGDCSMCSYLSESPPPPPPSEYSVDCRSNERTQCLFSVLDLRQDPQIDLGVPVCGVELPLLGDILFIHVFSLTPHAAVPV